jgi:hypothetical protein
LPRGSIIPGFFEKYLLTFSNYKLIGFGCGFWGLRHSILAINQNSIREESNTHVLNIIPSAELNLERVGKRKYSKGLDFTQIFKGFCSQNNQLFSSIGTSKVGYKSMLGQRKGIRNFTHHERSGF